MKQEERPWILASHLGTLLGYTIVLGSFLIPLIIWLSKKDESVEIARHAKASLNFQISVAIYTLIAGFFVLFLVGIPFLLILPVFNVVCVILATIDADKGRLFNYPLSIKFVQ